MKNFREPEGQLAHWLEKLQEFDFTIVHRPGQRYGNADALSRIPCTQCGREQHGSGGQEESAQVSTISGHVSTLVGKSLGDLRDLQLHDPCIGPVLRCLELDESLDDNNTRTQPPHTRCLLQQRKQLVVKDGVLWRQFEDPEMCIQVMQQSTNGYVYDLNF